MSNSDLRANPARPFEAQTQPKPRRYPNLAVFYLVLRVLAVSVASVAFLSTVRQSWVIPVDVIVAIAGSTVVLTMQDGRAVSFRAKSLPDLDLSWAPQLKAWFDEVCAEYGLDIRLKAGLVSQSRFRNAVIRGESAMTWPGPAYIGIDVDSHFVSELGPVELHATLAHEVGHILARHRERKHLLPTLTLVALSGLMAALAFLVVEVAPSTSPVGVAALNMVLGLGVLWSMALLPLPVVFRRLVAARDRQFEWEADLIGIALMDPEEALNAELTSLATQPSFDLDYAFLEVGGIYPSHAQRMAWITGLDDWLDPESVCWKAIGRMWHNPVAQAMRAGFVSDAAGGDVVVSSTLEPSPVPVPTSS